MCDSAYNNFPRIERFHCTSSLNFAAALKGISNAQESESIPLTCLITLVQPVPRAARTPLISALPGGGVVAAWWRRTCHSTLFKLDRIKVLSDRLSI